MNNPARITKLRLDNFNRHFIITRQMQKLAGDIGTSENVKKGEPVESVPREESVQTLKAKNPAPVCELRSCPAIRTLYFE